MPIHGDPTIPACGQSFQHDNGTRVEVFETPFTAETRAVANQCFERFHKMNQRDLNSDTPRADSEARSLALTGLQWAIREARRNGNEALAEHFTELLAEMPRVATCQWLNGLAVQGCGRMSANPAAGNIQSANRNAA